MGKVGLVHVAPLSELVKGTPVGSSSQARIHVGSEPPLLPWSHTLVQCMTWRTM